MQKIITKRSGEQEPFNAGKFHRSLKKAGVKDQVIAELIAKVQRNQSLNTTQDIYKFVAQELKKRGGPEVVRYNLKQALLTLGPAGFPFERYITELYRQMGYESDHNQIVKGQCVDHEIDVIAQQHDRILLIECKYHNRDYLKSDIKVALYVHARIEDIQHYWKSQEYRGNELREGWIITNTKFSSQAIKYALCAGVQLLGWNYPEHKTLPDLINQIGLHPITALTTLKKYHKIELLKENIVLCCDLKKHIPIMRSVGMTPLQIDLALHEAEKLALLPIQS